jgi:hypothetical protein
VWPPIVLVALEHDALAGVPLEPGEGPGTKQRRPVVVRPFGRDDDRLSEGLRVVTPVTLAVGYLVSTAPFDHRTRLSSAENAQKQAPK